MGKIIFIIRITSNIWRNFQSHFSTIFTPDFNLLSCELDNFIVILSHFILILYRKKQNCEHIHNTFIVPCEKYKTVSLPL